MLHSSRRTFLSGVTAAPALAQSTSNKPTQTTTKKGERFDRKILASRATTETLANVLLDRSRWKPFPTAADRNSWGALPAAAKDSMLKNAAANFGKAYAPLPASLFLEFKRNGNRSRFEAVQSSRRNHLRESVLAECVEGKGQFLDDIADGIWATCEETFWGYPAHIGVQQRGTGLPDPDEPIIDLFAAETGALLAWTHYLLGASLDKVHPLVRERLVTEVKRRILDVYRLRDDFGWMGFRNRSPVNNWNPWINSNVLAASLLLDHETAVRARTAAKVLRSLDHFLDSYHDDGGCDEGPGYWSRAGASLFDNLELLHSATEGKLSFYNVPLVKEIGRYIHRVHIAGDWFVNFADASAKAHPEGLLIRRYGEAIQDVELESFGALLAAQSTGLGTIGRSLPALFHAGRPVKSVAPLVREAWMPGTQVCTARRQAGTAEGLYFAAQGGHNAESHNHNDVGNFILFSNGDPVLIDVGVETYTAKTFSSKRYEIWTMQSAYHNCPTINGAMQAAGRQYEARDVAFHSDDAGATFSADLAAAYPAEAGVRSWLRKIHLDRRTNSLELSDTYALRTANDLAMSFITPCAAMTDGNVVTLSGGMLTKGTVRISVDAAQTPRFAVEEIDVTDRRLQGVWGNRLRRILISWQKPSANGTLRFRIT